MPRYGAPHFSSRRAVAAEEAHREVLGKAGQRSNGRPFYGRSCSRRE